MKRLPHPIAHLLSDPPLVAPLPSSKLKKKSDPLLLPTWAPSAAVQKCIVAFCPVGAKERSRENRFQKTCFRPWFGLSNGSVVLTHGRRLFSIGGGENASKIVIPPKMALGERILFAFQEERLRGGRGRTNQFFAEKKGFLWKDKKESKVF